MKLKKTLIVSSEFPPEPGGIGNHAYNLAKYLQQNNFEITVVSDQRLRNNKIERDYDKNLSFKVIRTKLRKYRAFMYVIRVFQIFKEIRKNDIIIATGKFSLLIVSFSTLFYKKKNIAIIHGSEVNFKKRILKKAIDTSLRKFHRIIAVSNYTKSLIDNLGLLNIKVICNGFELDKSTIVNDTKKIKGYPSLITVGSVSQRKGQQNIIYALPEIIRKYPNVHYHIVGKPIEKAKNIKIANELNVSDYITFYGIVSEKEKIDLLSRSNIFMMLSENTLEGDVEGFGIALLEANYLGIPSIGAKNCGIEDAIQNNKSGILVNNKNKDEIVRAIETILEDYPNYVIRSKKWALSFTWDKVIKKYIKTLDF